MSRLEPLEPAQPAPASLNQLLFGTDEPNWGAGVFNVDETVNDPALFADISAADAQSRNNQLPFSREPLVPAPAFFLQAADPLDRARAIHCLSLAVYYEAKSEPLIGQQAVAQVVLNRVRHPAWPNSVCGVVFQGSERRTGCQFTFTCDGSLARPPAGRSWALARGIATAALSGHVVPEVGLATHYHADYVAPRWAPSLRKLAKIGLHIFYTWQGRGGTPTAFRDRYSEREAWPRKAAATDPSLGPANAPPEEAASIPLGPPGGGLGAVGGASAMSPGTAGIDGLSVPPAGGTTERGASEMRGPLPLIADGPANTTTRSMETTPNPRSLPAEPDLESLIPRRTWADPAPVAPSAAATAPPRATSTPMAREPERSRALDGL